MNLERIIHDNRTRPDAIHQFVLGDKFTGCLGQDFDYLKGPATNWYG